MFNETYIKQFEKWEQINVDFPDNTKYKDFIESLKVNKDIRGPSMNDSEHVLSVPDKKEIQTVARVVKILKTMCGLT